MLTLTDDPPPPPSEAPALPSPRKKFNVVVYYFLFVNNVESSTLFPSSRKKIWAVVIVNTITFRKICLLTGLLIFRAVADPRNSHKNAKYREICQKYFQIHVAKTYLILILAIRPVLFTPNFQIYLETSSLQWVNNVPKLPGVFRWTLRKTGH